MALFSTTSGVAVVDTRIQPGTITLPLTSQIPNRYIQIKDLYGAFGVSTLTLSTQGGETFDDGTTSKVLSDPFSFFTLYAASTTRWAQLGGTQTIQQTISSLNVSSINGALPGAGGGLTTGNLVSTVVGLGTTGYLSTIPLGLSTTAFFTSSILASTITTSSLQVDSLTIGTGTGWLNLGPLQTVAISSIQANVNNGYINNLYVGIQSTLNTIQFNGLFGNYNNTVLAEISTGGGSQEFLVFKGSSTSDRVRVQTTGTFVVETGVSARLFNSNTTQTLSNATPAFIINTSSNVGIQTASPGATLDVAGTARAIILSSQQLNVSSVNGQLPGEIRTTQMVSTVEGLGSSSYVSTLSLVSTTGAITYGYGSGLSSLSTFITSLPGYQGQLLYMNEATSVSPYKQLSPYESISSLQSTITSLPATSDNNLLAAFQSDFPLPAFIPNGIWDMNLFANADDTDVSFYYNLYSRAPDTSELFLFGSRTVPVGTTGILQYTNSLPVTYTPLPAASTLVVKLFGSNSAALTRTFTAYFQDAYYSHIHTTFNSGQETGASGVSSLSTLVGLEFDTISLEFLSTVEGLGSSDYISSSQLLSTTGGIQTQFQTAGFLSSLNLQSTVEGLGSSDYISSSQLVSTATGLYEAIGGAVFTSSLNASTLLVSSLFNSLTISTNALVVYGTSSIHSTINIQQQLFFNDLSTGTIGNPIFQSSSLLYYGNSVISGVSFATIQTITF